ncbi:hypothetical protein RI129_007972 [Pyrocoelia pectoralis]|uniref:Uncharacterized protein n=1 Tax=Pyrocoelia pectoralis TaxID=417401 RepID=A0AAN7VAN0_9COLE
MSSSENDSKTDEIYDFKPECYTTSLNHGMSGTVSEPYNHNLMCKYEHKKRQAQCPIYVHHFNQNVTGSSNSYTQNDRMTGSKIHQSRYKHECNDFNKTLRLCKTQFDNLTLNTKCVHPSKNVMDRIGHHGKYHSGAKIDKSFLFKVEHKAVADKLEETYWAKWKPKKSPSQTYSAPKTKGLYTENEKVITTKDTVSETKEMGDSNEAIVTTILPVSEQMAENKEEPEPQMEEPVEFNTNEDRLNLSPEPNSDSDIPAIKHTDSLILITKKNSASDNPHYQQPKCIKLFKNPGYASTATVNYIKGGSYPLKSCLRKESVRFKTSSVFGVKSISRSSAPGKAIRFMH